MSVSLSFVLTYWLWHFAAHRPVFSLLGIFSEAGQFVGGGEGEWEGGGGREGKRGAGEGVDGGRKEGGANNSLRQLIGNRRGGQRGNNWERASAQRVKERVREGRRHLNPIPPRHFILPHHNASLQIPSISNQHILSQLCALHFISAPPSSSSIRPHLCVAWPSSYSYLIFFLSSFPPFFLPLFAPFLGMRKEERGILVQIDRQKQIL